MDRNFKLGIPPFRDVSTAGEQCVQRSICAESAGTGLQIGKCGGEVKIIASIEDPAVVGKILAHLDQRPVTVEIGLLPEGRAPPTTGLFV